MTAPHPDNHDSWRDKYLDALDAQETLEQEAEAQYQRLRRALVQVSIVADGQDRLLDETLDELRRALRPEGPAGTLTELTERLDEQVHGFERRRGKTEADIAKALGALVRQLQKLGPPRELKRQLKHYQDRLPGRSQSVSLFPALLEQLADLQARTFEQTRGTTPGLLGRVAGKKAGGEDVSEPLLGEARALVEALLGAVDSDYLDREEMDAVREQLAGEPGLSELVGVLEQVRDLLTRAWLNANRVFADYLDSVNRELTDIAGLVGVAAGHQDQRREAGDRLQREMSESCESLAGSVESARDLSQLKSRVAGQLDRIRESLDQFRQAETDTEPLTEQLEQLSSRVQQMEREAEQSRESLRRHRHKATHDALTGLPNREAYEERLAHEVKRWERYGHPLTLAVCDVDHFKRINDRFGHQAGDRVLKVISRAIRQRLREVDFLGRFGGEEFVLLLPETGAEDALSVLEDVRIGLAETAFHYRQEPLQITLSMGLAEFREGENGDVVFGRADRALYGAKAAGRNQCQIG